MSLLYDYQVVKTILLVVPTTISSIISLLSREH